jgi:AcrR family transcriptional regulator
MTTPQDRKRTEREARRRKIQAAARPIFVERGFAATSIEQIARSAEMSVGAIYLYFQSKEDLYVSLLPEALAPLEAALAAERESHEHEERLTAVWSQLLGWSQREPEAARALGLLARPDLAKQLTAEASQGAGAAIARVKEQLAGSIADGITAGTYRQADPAAVAELVWSAFVGGLTGDLVATNLGQSVPERASLIAVIEASLRADGRSMRRAA